MPTTRTNSQATVSVQPSPLRFIIAGGGTGGHVFPAIAIANALRQQHPNAQILFVGAQGRIEMEKVPQAGYPIEGLWISGLQRRLTAQNLLFPAKLAHSLWQSYRIIRRFKPHAVVGVGGYASGALLQVATMLGVPALIQEQNSHAGITNRLLSKRVQKICVVYDNLGKYFPPEKIIITGNPVRQDLVRLEGSRSAALAHFGLDPKRRTLLVTGGSLGARGINEGVVGCLEQFKQHNLQVVWQTGKLYSDWATHAVQGYEQWVHPMPFIDRMDWAYIAADGIVSRAGGTISELCIVGKPVVLMPSPNVAEDHQTANAMNLVAKNAALLVRDRDADTQLWQAIHTILFDEAQRQLLSQNIKKLAITDAADRIAHEVTQLALGNHRS